MCAGLLVDVGGRRAMRRWPGGGSSASIRELAGLSVGPAPDSADDAHGRLAVRAAHRRSRLLLTRSDEHTQDPLYQRQSLLCLAVQEPVVAHAPQASRQHLLQNLPEKIGNG